MLVFGVCVCFFWGGNSGRWEVLVKKWSWKLDKHMFTAWLLFEGWIVAGLQFETHPKVGSLEKGPKAAGWFFDSEILPTDMIFEIAERCMWLYTCKSMPFIYADFYPYIQIALDFKWLALRYWVLMISNYQTFPLEEGWRSTEDTEGCIYPMKSSSYSPPVRWGLLDFMSVSSPPSSSSSPSSPSSFSSINWDPLCSVWRAGPQWQLGSSQFSVACWTPIATGILSVQCGVLDPNRDLMSSVWRAGPQPRYCEFSVACWTPTATLRVECGVLDPNRDSASSVWRAGPQPRSCEFSVACRTSSIVSEILSERMTADMSERMTEDMSGRMSGDMSKRYVKKNARRYVRKNGERYVRKNVKKICQKECQKICQKECQKICQKDMSERYVRRCQN